MTVNSSTYLLVLLLLLAVYKDIAPKSRRTESNKNGYMITRSVGDENTDIHSHLVSSDSDSDISP